MCDEPSDMILAKVIRIVEDCLERPRGTLAIDTQAGDVEAWDSFGHVRIILALEAYFAIAFTMAEIEGASSIAALVRIVEAAKARAGGQPRNQ